MWMCIIDFILLLIRDYSEMASDDKNFIYRIDYFTYIT